MGSPSLRFAGAEAEERRARPRHSTVRPAVPARAVHYVGSPYNECTCDTVEGLETFHHDGAPPPPPPPTTTAPPLLLLPLVILQHLLVHPPELNMPSCALRLCPALLTLDPFLLLVAISITIALLLLDISLRVHVTESGGLHARRPHTDLAPHVLYRTVRNAFHLSVTRA